jgi:succinate dehydrogenase flavin-adding protein (antitoxin of CptAB toxin-antitoxin module)
MNRIIKRVPFWFSGARPMPLETDLAALRKQLIFRSKNLGVRELDLIVGTWASRVLPSYSMA